MSKTDGRASYELTPDGRGRVYRQCSTRVREVDDAYSVLEMKMPSELLGLIANKTRESGRKVGPIIQQLVIALADDELGPLLVDLVTSRRQPPASGDDR
jgi:hypothetical protein